VVVTVYHQSVYHQSVYSSVFSESWGKILGLVAAPLVGDTATVPSLQKRAVQYSAVSQSGSQSDTQLRMTDSQIMLAPCLRDILDSGPGIATCHHGHTQLPIAPTAFSPHPNVEPLDNRCNEREEGNDSQLHACEELPEIIAAIESDRSRLDSVDTVPSLVDDDTS
jgi:hypothetical protein